ncbi:MAG: TonB-dependent receptor [Gammaproteobacteria bacterium]|jgi:iron complex outermembrane receptor protein
MRTNFVAFHAFRFIVFLILTLGLSLGAWAAALEEVVVTAQKREQSLQDVSTAVSAVDMNRLVNAHINNLEDLQFIVPSITLGNDFNMAKLFIRGVGANTSTTGSETGVAFSVDGAVVARAEAQLTSLFDLKRVEVIRGPSGTLYGRNAVGGSVNLVTNKPTRDPEGYAHASIGNYGLVSTEGAIGGPVNDWLLGRVAVKTEDRGGYGINPATGADVDNLHRRMFRTHLEILPADNWNILLTGEYYTQDDHSGALHFRRDAFPGVPRLLAGERQPAGVPTHAIAPRDTASEINGGTNTDTWSVTGTITWEPNENITIKNITNYRHFGASLTQDLDLGAVQNSLATTGFNTTVQRRDIDSDQSSNEFQFHFHNDWSDSVLGLFYFHERQRPIDTVGLGSIVGQAHILNTLANPASGFFPPIGPTGLEIDGQFVPEVPIPAARADALCNDYSHIGKGIGQTLPPKRVCINSDLGTDAYAVFAHTHINLGVVSDALANFALKLGGRWNWEKRTATNASIIVARNGLGPIIMTTAAGSANEKIFRSFTPEVGIEWRATPEMMLYYTYSEGFKAGAGENATPSTPVGTSGRMISTIVKPEKIKNHEFGLKSTWFSDRLSVNLAGYFYELTGQQINKTIAGGPAGFGTIFENAAKTSAHGIELDFAATPTDQFRVNGAVSWLVSRYDNFLTTDPLDPRNILTPGVSDGNPLTDFSPQGDIQLAGNPTRNSPEWTASLHAEYDIRGLNLPYDGWLTLMGDVSYRGDTYFTEFHRFIEGQKAYALLDFNLRYTSGNEHFFTEFWVKNATDKLAATSTFQLATARVIGVTYMPPRTYGVTLGYSF